MYYFIVERYVSKLVGITCSVHCLKDVISLVNLTDTAKYIVLNIDNNQERLDFTHFTKRNPSAL